MKATMDPERRSIYIWEVLLLLLWGWLCKLRCLDVRVGGEGTGNEHRRSRRGSIIMETKIPRCAGFPLFHSLADFPIS